MADCAGEPVLPYFPQFQTGDHKSRTRLLLVRPACLPFVGNYKGSEGISVISIPVLRHNSSGHKDGVTRNSHKNSPPTPRTPSLSLKLHPGFQGKAESGAPALFPCKADWLSWASVGPYVANVTPREEPAVRHGLEKHRRQRHLGTATWIRTHGRPMPSHYEGQRWEVSTYLKSGLKR